MAIKKRKIKSRRAKLTPQQIEQRAYRREVRAVFKNMGFIKVFSVSDKEFNYKGHKSDFDDVFVYKNVIVFAEYTLTMSKNLSSHLKPKKLIYDQILSDKQEFIDYYAAEFPGFKEALDDMYDTSQCRVIILYCSKNSINPELKDKLPDINFFEYPILRYFKSVSTAIRLSARFEFFSFLGLGANDVGLSVLSPAQAANKFEGSVLPEAHSNYKKGYKVVSFYVDPESLLSRSYVLRNDGWNDASGLYQRMIANAKILSIRKYLNEHGRVFVNNIIVTLPDTTKIIDSNGDTVNPSELSKTSPVTIQIPQGFNMVGIIDGQHRVFAYHEGGRFDDKISKLRVKQNLLATGIIYPKNTTRLEKTKFEATLFMEINSNQTSAKSDLKQAIGLLLNPFSSEAVAKAVINKLNNHGPLEDTFERHFYDKDKLKTSSIVSFALKPIVKQSGSDSFYSIWDNQDKKELSNGVDAELLDNYITYCAKEIEIFISAVKSVIKDELWTTDRNVEGRVLTVTVINGLIICLRKLVENNKKYTFKTYKQKLKNFNKFKIERYKSSQYSRMAEDIYKEYF